MLLLSIKEQAEGHQEGHRVVSPAWDRGLEVLWIGLMSNKPVGLEKKLEGQTPF